VLESDLEQRGQLSLAVLEILNYVAAAQLAFEWVEDRPLTGGLMGELRWTPTPTATAGSGDWPSFSS
jgi:cell filamentation protein, protein adenylyltransferase